MFRSGTIKNHKIAAAFRAIVYSSFISLAAAPLAAGPVPGVETFDKEAVDFPVPESLTVWDIGNDEFLVTFRWEPDFEVRNPAVAGTFNDWSRSDLPMEGPDAEGGYEVTARILAGEHRYKFVANGDGWYEDPLNPPPPDSSTGDAEFALGFFAIVQGIDVEKGDGAIEPRAVEHRPASRLYKDVIDRDEVLLRVRAMRDDTESAEVVFELPDGGEVTQPMTLAASDRQFDFYEYHYDGSEWDERPVGYQFVLMDGDGELATDEFSELRFETDDLVDTPEWAKHAVWYQIMVDRFRDGDPTNNPEYHTDYRSSRITHPWTSSWYDEQPWERDDERGYTFWEWAMYDRLYGGDFQGVIDKLDYLKDLGVTAIYLNPVFQASNSHKYNARSYIHADDMYGVPGEHDRVLEMEDPLDSSTWVMNESDKLLVRLIDEAHQRGMRIIFDGVWNHVGDDHPIFLDVRENRQESRYADWFTVTSWEPFEYEGWAGYDALPEFRKANEDLASASLKEHIFEATRRWMDPNGDGDPSDGIDGWRLDVPMHLPMPFWEEWREHVKSINPEAYIVGEIWDPAEEWLDGRTFDAVMNYQLPKIAFRWFSNVEDKITASEFDRLLARLRIRYPLAHTLVLQNLFDSHDTDRWVSMIANPDRNYDAGNRVRETENVEYMDERPSAIHYERLKLMAVFQNTYLGAPMIWYGTEVGMFGADDPMTRMPMWWEDLGPYDDPDYIIMDDLRGHFRALFHLRHATPELRTGDFRTAVADDEKDVFGYWRWKAGTPQAMLTLLNNSGRIQTVEIDSPEDISSNGFSDYRTMFGDAEAVTSGDQQTLTVTLPPLSGVVIQVVR